MQRTGLLLAGLFFFNAAFSQHAKGDKTSAEEYATFLKAADRATRDLENLPSSYSLKKYSPPVGDQGNYGTCVAWSSAYAARTISFAIKRNLTNPDSIRKYAFSPGYLYYKIKDEGDDNCDDGASIKTAMEVMAETGAMLKREGPVDCTDDVSEEDEQKKAAPYKIKDFLSLNDVMGTIEEGDIIKIKKSLSEKKPVVFGLRCYPSVSKISSSGLWYPTSSETSDGGHAMCIIGYDDNKAGGAFEVMNSWGTNWGNSGFFWLTYDQMLKHGKYAAEMMDFENIIKKPEISGDIEFVKLDGSMMPVIRKKINSRGLIVEDDDKSDYSLYYFKEKYTAGTSFKIKFSTNSPSYVYIFSEDDQKVISRLFPYNRNISAAINSANATYYFPSETKHARISATPGKDDICVLYSKVEIDFESLMSYITTTKMSVYDAVKEKLGNRLLPFEKIKFNNDKITFETPAEERSVLCFFIEMDHQ